MNKYCTYLRVSTQRQGAQGLGIEAQRKMCSDFIERNNGISEQEFMDVESGTHRDRKGLWNAIEYCQKHGVGLVIAKLDRLARDVEFTFKVINTGIEIHFTDMPVVNSMVLGVFAAVAQYEREMCSKRTKQALAALKARGDVKLGAANETFRQNYNNKPKEERMKIHMKKGQTKRSRFQESRDTTAFLRVLRNVFPEATKGEPAEWDWKQINSQGENKTNILKMMRDYKEIDDTGATFRKWNFDAPILKLQVRLCSYIQTMRRTFLK